jgi:hypothetical protein
MQRLTAIIPAACICAFIAAGCSSPEPFAVDAQFGVLPETEVIRKDKLLPKQCWSDLWYTSGGPVQIPAVVVVAADEPCPDGYVHYTPGP